MVYAAFTFWLMVIVLTAWGVQQLWRGMIKPKVFNIILLPGTLVAQLGHVLGLLITGATITNTTLIKDDDEGEPETTPNPQPRIPVVGPIVIGMLPLVACGVAIFFLARFLGRPVIGSMDTTIVGPHLPTTMHGFWELLRSQITLVESFFAAATAVAPDDWRGLVFLYLLVCLTVRIAPFPGYLRGSLGAIVVLGISAAVVASLFDVADPRVQSGWATLNLTVATLLFLLLASLLVRGGVGLMKLLREPQ